MPLPPLSPQLFVLFAGFIHERCGLSYRAGDATLLGSKLADAASEAGFDSLLDYYYFLHYDDASGEGATALVDRLVVNETFFFREHVQVERAVDEEIAPRLARGERVRVWSAACSTGEEPLSLAMLLAERGLLDQVQLLATDLSGRALARAQGGRYGARAVRGTPRDALLPKWTTSDEGGLVVSEALRRAIRFSRVNLALASDVEKQGKFAVIFCRNVLIYFDDATVTRVVAALAGALVPGGILCVGATESLLRFSTTLSCEEQGGAFFYRKARAS